MTLPKDPQKREEYLRNMREKARERMANPEFKALVNERKKAAYQRPDVKARMRQSRLNYLKNPANAEKIKADEEKRVAKIGTPEVREKFSKAKKEYMAIPENLEAMKASVKKAMNRPEVKDKMSVIRKNAWGNPVTRENYQKSFDERWLRPGEREKISETTKAAMANITNTDAYREALAAGMAKSRKKYKGTDIEIIVEALLQALGVTFEAQKHVGHWVADFYIPSHNLILECDGDYWHSSEWAKDRDMRKDRYLTEKGYKVLRILGSQIHAKEFNALFEALGMEV